MSELDGWLGGVVLGALVVFGTYLLAFAVWMVAGWTRAPRRKRK